MRTLLLAITLAVLGLPAQELKVCGSVPLYEPCEIEFEMTEAEAAQHPNPYLTAEVRAEFRSPKKGTTSVMPGFWDGGRRFKLRFAPLDEGRWDFRIISNLPSVERKIASFEATAPRTPGFISVFNLRYFRYNQPETPHFWMGDTCYSFATIPWETFTKLVDIRASQKFNHLRGLVLGWEENAGRVLADPDRLLPEHFQEVDRRVAYMNGKGITYDLILGGDQNQLAELLPKPKQRERYVRYLIARYAALNIVWQGVQEFEEYEDGPGLLKEINGYLQKMDPYQHPRSTHTVQTSGPLFADGWMNYVVEQSSDPDLATVDYEIYTAPQVNAEFAYENSGAGKSHDHHVDTDTFRKRLWNAAVRGQYPTFGNTGTYGGRKFDVNLQFADSPGARQMAILYDFFTQTRYIDLQRHYRVEGGVALNLERPRAYGESFEGVEYIVYVEKPAPLELLVQKGKYDVSWFNPIDGSWTHQKDKFNGERFSTPGPPDASHDWVLYVRREGRKEGMNRSYFLESKRAQPKKVETAKSEVPYEIQMPDQSELVAGREYDFNATVTKDSRAARQSSWLWLGEVAGSGTGYRVLGTKQFGKFQIPEGLASRYPATLQIRLLAVDGVGRVFEVFKPYRLAAPAAP